MQITKKPARWHKPASRILELNLIVVTLIYAHKFGNEFSPVVHVELLKQVANMSPDSRNRNEQRLGNGVCRSAADN